eukprot:1245516-Karenia_brevis.AAC.1
MTVDREAIEEDELRECLLTIDEYFDRWCNEALYGGRPWGLGVGDNHPRYHNIMRELSDGVMAAYVRKKVLIEAGQGWSEAYQPAVAYFMD